MQHGKSFILPLPKQATMIIGVLKEPQNDTRVSLLPEAVAALIKKGITVLIETNAGTKAFAADKDYEAAGAKISSATEIATTADIILSIQAPEIEIVSKILIGVYQPLYNTQFVKKASKKDLSVFSLDLLPRKTYNRYKVILMMFCHPSSNSYQQSTSPT